MKLNNTVWLSSEQLYERILRIKRRIIRVLRRVKTLTYGNLGTEAMRYLSLNFSFNPSEGFLFDISTLFIPVERVKKIFKRKILTQTMF